MAQGTETKVKRAALVGDRALVFTTPVDTGRAQTNWVASIGSPTELVGSDGFGSASAAVANASSVINTWKLGQGPIFLANSVPYIVRLDEGWSAQAPKGMTTAAIQAMRRELNKGKVFKR